VDLLAVQLCHHVADPAAHRADAGALRVHAPLVRPDRDLGAMAGLARDGGDLHDAAGHLRYLQGEQLLDQARMRARQRDRGAAVAAIRPNPSGVSSYSAVTSPSSPVVAAHTVT